MEQGRYIIRACTPLARDTFGLALAGDTRAFRAPGQFAAVSVPGFFLRRPFSVCDWDETGFSLVFRAEGPGTRALAALAPGTELDVLTGLGNGFDLKKAGARPLLAGGGTGASPLLGLCRRLAGEGTRCTVALGFASAEDAVLTEAFAALGVRVLIATADGSLGLRGLVTDAAARAGDCTCCYACGPLPMLRALGEALDCPGEISLEARMGCGFGACMGCTIRTAAGPRRVCRDGPVFPKEAVVW